MKKILIIFSTILLSCNEKMQNDTLPIIGTWKLISGTTIEKGDTTVVDYTKTVSFIKIINDSHFAFLKHSLSKTKDSTATFDAGGGRYSLKNNEYTEHLEYYQDKAWEGNNFKFTVSIKNDSLVQSGIEKIEKEGINRINIEKYIRLKN